MPYRRRTTSRRRRPTRRRRSFKRMRMMRTTSQRYFKHKMTVFDKIVPTTGGSSVIKGGYALQQPYGVNTNLVRGFDNSDRWLTTYKQYEEYAITGMKIRWIPGNARGGVIVTNGATLATPSWLGSMFLYFDTDTYDTSTYGLNEISQLEKSWIFDPTKSWSKYFSCKNLSRMQNVAWQDTRDYTPSTFNKLTKASVGYFLETNTGTTSPTPPYLAGYFKVSYYVTFRGQAKN